MKIRRRRLQRYKMLKMLKVNRLLRVLIIRCKIQMNKLSQKSILHYITLNLSTTLKPCMMQCMQMECLSKPQQDNLSNNNLNSAKTFLPSYQASHQFATILITPSNLIALLTFQLNYGTQILTNSMKNKRNSLTLVNVVSVKTWLLITPESVNIVKSCTVKAVWTRFS